MCTATKIILSLIITQLIFVTSTSLSANQTTITTTSNSTIAAKTNTTSSSPVDQVIIEGGGIINLAAPAAPTSTNVTSTVNQTSPTKRPEAKIVSSTTPRLIPIYEDKPALVSKTVPEHKMSVGKKGVDFAEGNVTTTKPPLKKPTVTIPGEEEPYAPSHFQKNGKSNDSQHVSQVPLDILSNSQESTQKYVVPIVVVILSVPFVAIIISILYKRGVEWWRYRHYRRMDFLINGMYDG